MEHLKQTHKKKEIDIEHTKKLIEEKALLEARSDPESIHDSVTSSLTASSRRSTSPEENGSDKESSSSSDMERQSRKKRKTISYAEGIKGPTCEGSSNKKSRSRAKRKEPSSSESSSEEDAGNEGEEGPGGKNISFDKTSSSVSDMTDSNRSSMNGNGVNKKKQILQQAKVNSEAGTASTGTSSISSTAAVVRGSSHKSPQSHRRHRSPTLDAIAEGHGDSMKKAAHKKKRRSFDYNYKEVFLKSNIPQLIVTLSGRVVVCKYLIFARDTTVHHELHSYHFCIIGRE